MIEPPLNTRPSFQAYLICLVAALFYCYEFFLRIVPGALHRELMLSYGNISATSFGELASLYYFAYSPMQLPVGMLMDRYGPRRLLIFACSCCALGSFLFGLSSSLLMVGIGRFLVGFGSSFAFVGVLSLTLHWMPRRYFSFIAGLITTVGMLGLVYGEIKVTHFAASMGLPFVLDSMVLLGLALTVLIFIVVRDGPKEGPPLAHQDFIYHVYQVLTSSQVWIMGFIGACLYTSLSVFGELWGKVYLEQAHHLSSFEAASTISFVFIGWAVGAPLAGFLADRWQCRFWILFFGSLLALLCIYVVLYGGDLSYYTLNLLMFFYGLFSGVEIIVFLMAKENSGLSLSGTVFAATNMIVSLSGVIFQPLVGFFLDYSRSFSLSSGHEKVYNLADYRFALSILPVFLFLVLFSVFFIKDKPRKHQSMPSSG